MPITRESIQEDLKMIDPEGERYIFIDRNAQPYLCIVDKESELEKSKKGEEEFNSPQLVGFSGNAKTLMKFMYYFIGVPYISGKMSAERCQDMIESVKLSMTIAEHMLKDKEGKKHVSPESDDELDKSDDSAFKKLLKKITDAL